MNDMLILVDENDMQTGFADKLSVHRSGLLHRAFSIFIFNERNELLLQQRADGKYHSPGLWTNTCCSHPVAGETMTETVDRRLKEEMGFSCPTDFLFSFVYKAQFDNGLTEHEFDHVFTGQSNEVPEPNPAEVKNWRYVNMDVLANDIVAEPATFTEWLKICLPMLKDKMRNLTGTAPAQVSTACNF